MKYDVLFTDGHVETVDVEPGDSTLVSDTTIAEVTAVQRHPGYSRVVKVTPHTEMVELGNTTRTVIDYIQQTYDALSLDPTPDTEARGYQAGIDFMVQQLGLPIKLRR